MGKMIGIRFTDSNVNKEKYVLTVIRNVQAKSLMEGNKCSLSEAIYIICKGFANGTMEIECDEIVTSEKTFLRPFYRESDYINELKKKLELLKKTQSYDQEFMLWKTLNAIKDEAVEKEIKKYILDNDGTHASRVEVMSNFIDCLESMIIKTEEEIK